MQQREPAGVVEDEEFGPLDGEGWSPTYDSAALEKASGASFQHRRAAAAAAAAADADEL